MCTTTICVCVFYYNLLRRGRGPQPAVWRGAAVLHRLWPPSPCQGAAPCGLCLVAGGGSTRHPPQQQDTVHVLLLRGCDACRTVGVGLQSGATLIDVRLDVGSLPPRSSSLTVTGCLLGGFPAGHYQWGGECIVGGVLPRINIGTTLRKVRTI